MKLKKEFITHEIDGQQVMVGVGTDFKGIIRSNPTAAFIVNCLKKETSEQEIVQAMLMKYDAEEEQVKKDVHNILEKLKEFNVLDL